jgi:hypothetical protein
VALTSVAVGLGALRVRAALRRAPPGERWRRLEVGPAAPSGFRLPRLRALGLLDIEVRWCAPARVRCELRARRGRLDEWIEPLRRFEVGGVARRIAVGDALGLASCAWQHSRAQLVTALPAPGAQHVAPAPLGIAAGELEARPAGPAQGDRLDSRPYRPGDPARHILWRSWARSRQLFARVPEPSAAPSRRIAAYLICGPEDEAAAGAARRALESGVLGDDWVLGADGCAGEAKRLDDGLALLARSGGARGATRIGTFAARAAADVGAGLLVFAPAQPGPWQVELERVVRARAGDCAIVLALDASPPAARRLRLRKPRASDRPELAELRTRLGALARLVVVERAAGASGAAAALAVRNPG